MTGTAGNVRLVGVITIPVDRQAALVPLLDAHTALTRAEAGCLHFDVKQDSESPTLFHVSELFVDDAAFAVHQAEGAARAWGPASADLVRDFHKEIL